MSGLELDRLECVRGGRRLFSGLSRRVERGTLLQVAGANGAGKTSLLRTVCGLMRPTEGQVRWEGQALGTSSFHRQLVYLGHAPALKDDLSAVENLQAALALAGPAVSTEQADRALVRSGLSAGRLSAPVRTLSQGQRKRVALARLALSPHAPLWVLDEPFNALDGAATDWLVSLLTQHLGQGGIVVLTSHQAVPWGRALPEVKIDL